MHATDFWRFSVLIPAFKNYLGKKMTVALSLWHNSQTFLVDLKLPERCWHQPSKKTRNCLQELITMSFPMNKKWLKLHIAKVGIKFYLHKEIEAFLLARCMILFLSSKFIYPYRRNLVLQRRSHTWASFLQSLAAFLFFSSSCFWNHILNIQGFDCCAIVVDHNNW